MSSGYDAFIPEALKKLSHKEAVEYFAAGADVPAREIRGLRREALLAHPVPNTWSIQQIVVHLLDSDLFAAGRMRRTIAESEPKVDAYDETAFASSLFYEEQDLQDVVAAFAANRRILANTLRRLPDIAFDRVALHPEAGRVTLGAFVRAYAHHLDHHLVFLRRKREMLEAATR